MPPKSRKKDCEIGEDILVQFCDNIGLSSNAVKTLRSECFTSKEALDSMDLDAIMSLNLRAGDICILKKHIASTKVQPSVNEDVSPMNEIPISKLLQGPPGTPMPQIGQSPDSSVTSTAVHGAAASISPLVYLTPVQDKAVGELKIIDFIDKSIEINSDQEQSISKRGDQNILVSKSSKREDKISPFEWAVANARIMAKLVQSGKLATQGVLEYQAYTVKIFQHAIAYEWQGVLALDREYRKAQHIHGFPWGADLSHLDIKHLKRKQTMYANKPPTQSVSVQKSQVFPYPCKDYNSEVGCSRTTCKFAHICADCKGKHPKVKHPSSEKAPQEN
ncbi:unnamed protein product [Owenia fusiformis]|uniref:Uncharacterized protein n=1 Tax=Owenia fusiformis TaxID=6347 RepID=A0A8J1UNJ1_OWEFU|nr:unnamed protein product [Owenia fusiformis]